MSAPSRHRQLAGREATLGWLLVAPLIIGCGVFLLVPMLVSLVLVFFDYDALSAPRFVGLENLQAMVVSRHFWNAWRVTVLYAVGSVALSMPLALVLALLLHRIRVGSSFWRVLFFLPVVLSGTGEALMLKQIWGQQGLINAALGFLGIQGPSWFSDIGAALPALIMSRYWTIGAAILFFLSARAAVPEELYEAAAIDGASARRAFRSITLPMMSPMILFNLVLGLVLAVQAFTQVYILTKGGPAGATDLTSLMTYREAFTNLRLGYASALSWILLAVTLAATAVILRSSRRWVYYESGESRL